MLNLTSDDVRRLLDCVHALHGCQSLDAFPDLLMQQIPMLVRSDCTSYTEVHLQAGRALGRIDEEFGPVDPLAAKLMAFMQEHPLIARADETKSRVEKISDHLSVQDYHRTGLYNELYGPMGMEDQMALQLPATAPNIFAVVVNRAKRDFSESDRTLLELIRPHIVQAYLNAMAVQRLRDQVTDSNDALSSAHTTFIRVDRAARPVYGSELALTWLGRQFPGVNISARLPGVVEDWIHQQRQLPTGALPKAVPCLHLRNESEQLYLRYVPAPAGQDAMVVITRKVQVKSLEPLERLGLTKRQAEVLYWMMNGKTNPEIGLILGASPRTVQKHVEHIFTKLHVETRTAAALIASETMQGVA